jgi:hypothetical protein
MDRESEASPAIAPDRRARLVEKRRLAQLRLSRALLSRAFRSVGRILCERDVRFSKLMPSRCVEVLGPLVSGPGQDERLLWDRVPGRSCDTWTSNEHRDDLLRQALSACTHADAPVAVIWHPASAGLRIGAPDLAAHAAPILDGEPGTIWIVAAHGGPWLIEIAFWDKEVCFARSMPVVC